MRRPRCYPGKHTDRAMRNGSVKCITCGDVFPCRSKCDHEDCAAARERPMPLWIVIEVPALREVRSVTSNPATALGHE